MTEVRYFIKKLKKQGTILASIKQDDSIPDVMKKLRNHFSDIRELRGKYDMILHIEKDKKQYRVITETWEEYKSLLYNDAFSLYAEIDLCNTIDLPKARRDRPRSGPSEDKIKNNALEAALRQGLDAPQRTEKQIEARNNMIQGNDIFSYCQVASSDIFHRISHEYV